MSKNISNLSGRIGLKDNLFKQISENTLSEKPKDIKEIAKKHNLGVSTLHGAESFYEFLRPSHREKKAFVISDSDIGCYSRPEIGNHVLIGSEDPICDERIFVDPDNWDHNFTEQWKTQLLRQAQRFPDMPISTNIKGVVALYDVSDDWIPIYDKSSLPGFYMAIGSSGNQYKNAPIAGVMMADLIEKCENGHDHDKNPIKLHLSNIKRDINVGFYSRNRIINTESSMSVLG